MYEPGLGYYSSGSHKIGEGGDFTTAPEISKYFSKAIARQTNRLLTMHDEPSIIEVGAGKGTFAFEYLKELEETGIEINRYYISRNKRRFERQANAVNFWLAKKH